MPSGVNTLLAATNRTRASPSSSRPRTTAFHAVDRGSNPLGDANFSDLAISCVPNHVPIAFFTGSKGTTFGLFLFAKTPLILSGTTPRLLM